LQRAVADSMSCPFPDSAPGGAMTDLLLGVLAVSAGMASAIFPDLWLRAAVIIGPTTLLSAVSAVGSALLFRYAAREQTPAGAEPEG
jgi:hypothetical protein